MNSNVSQRALIISTYSRRMLVKTLNGEIHNAKIKGKILKPVCGDKVEIVSERNEPEKIIYKIHTRKNELARYNQNRKKEIIAANLSMLAITVANPPKPDWFIVDRYIGAAELMGIKICLIINKEDLDWIDQETKKIIDSYNEIGYPIITCSAKKKINLNVINLQLKNNITIFVGQSGVGKSTIINNITYKSDQTTQAISETTSMGQHTTVNSNMIDLSDGGSVIDSPGTREFIPIINTETKVISSFAEIQKHGIHCKYNNCLHIRENICEVKSALRGKLISARRYESYKRLINAVKQSNKLKY
ncbi:MAG: ribosome small subunit-dependent GTPase A [Pseudomonadota bacterium]|nr:ribosome small subunit-dependent GTPase A [Pseudomonadota bacterium]